MNAPLFDAANFVILTAVEEERDAMLAHLPPAQRMPLSTDDVRTSFGTLLPVTLADGTKAIYNIIVQCLLDMGPVDAAMVTGDVIRRWKPDYVLLVGIAGGIAKNAAALGDVLIADQIVDYSQQKLTNKGRQFRFKGFDVSSRLSGFAQSLLPEEWLPHIKQPRPVEGTPARRRGPMASGPFVVEKTALLKQLLSSYPKLIGIEMEAGGAIKAASQTAHAPQFFMVRGVSDLCDPDRGSEAVQNWRLYACDVAAAYTASLLRHGPVPPRAALPLASDTRQGRSGSGAH